MKFIYSLTLAFVSVVLSAQDQQPMIGQQAPLFQLESTDGKIYSLEKLKGKYIVIHFAATWCPFCNAEAPYLEELHQNYKNKNVQVFIIDVKEDKALVEKLIERFRFSFPVLLDTNGAVSARYAPEGVQPALARHEVPIASNIVVDKEGKIRFYSLLNTLNFDAKLSKLQEKLEELLKTSN